jgi:hypothetical protein
MHSSTNIQTTLLGFCVGLVGLCNKNTFTRLKCIVKRASYKMDEYKTKEHLKIVEPRGALFRRARVRRRRRCDQLDGLNTLMLYSPKGSRDILGIPKRYLYCRYQR